MLVTIATILGVFAIALVVWEDYTVRKELKESKEWLREFREKEELKRQEFLKKMKDMDGGR